MPNKRLQSQFTALVILAATLLGSKAAQAHLGGSMDSIESDRSALAGVKGKTVNHTGYSVHYIACGSGAVLREYISPDKGVFGLAWNGHAHPDLDVLLHDYAAEYNDQVKRDGHKHGRRHRVTKTTKMSVEKWGHMRSLHGRAYDPALFPSGVTANDIK